MSRALALIACLIAPGVLAAADRPNLVVIYADDLGWGDLGCYGHPKFKTPNIDRLAEQGVRLTNFYSNCPYCAPSRAGLQTGRYQLRNGVWRNPSPDSGINDVGIPAREITLGEALRGAGYRTALYGKWHLGHKPQFFPRKHGYDEYFGILYSNDMYPVELIENEKMVEYPVYQATLTRRYTDRALSFIERNKDQPFFVLLAHAMPHKPLAASEEFYKKSGAGLYGDVMAELDANVGRILAKLTEWDLDDETFVVFTSDNGPWYGGSTGGLRGMKGQTWEGGLRVPFIARWPGRIPARTIRGEPAIILDLFPTILGAAGVELPADRVIDGKDLLATLASSEADASVRDRPLFGIRGDRVCSVRVGKWKLHQAPPGSRSRRDDAWVDPRAPNGVTLIAPYEQARPSEFPGVTTGDQFDGVALFDLEADAAEQHDLTDERPEVVKRLKSVYDGFVAGLPPERRGRAAGGKRRD